MNNRVTFMLSVLGAAALAAPVSAADGSAYDWSGFYVGVHGGYGWGEGESQTTAPSVEGDGWVGGVQLGYDHQLDNGLVLGVTADASLADIEGSELDGNFLRFSGETDYLGTVRLRLGYAVDRFLPYITGGLAWAHNEATMSCPAGAQFGVCQSTGAFEVSDDNTEFGWTVGAGVEAALSDSWSIKGEYLYADLGTQTYTFTSPLGTQSGDVDQTVSTFRIGLTYHFGAGTL